jgi:hypothetical protein
MAKAISVKVATPKVITALENKLEKVKKEYASQEANETKYQKEMTAWNKAISKIAIANVSKAENLRTNYRSWNKTLNIDFDITISEDELPAQPERNFEQMNSHTYKEIVSDIGNALSILRMTDEETVNATTMKSIAQYL